MRRHPTIKKIQNFLAMLLNLVGFMQKRKPPILHQVMEMGGGLMVYKFFFQMINLKLQRGIFVVLCVIF